MFFSVSRTYSQNLRFSYTRNCRYIWSAYSSALKHTNLIILDSHRQIRYAACRICTDWLCMAHLLRYGCYCKRQNTYENQMQIPVKEKLTVILPFCHLILD